ncbi:hypothetical protein SELMODRAFT_229009 [Selaginella moellendorffii]|uniref:Tetraspanin family protein n=1 Tax=Selaginella moellendorffii TaxID=88036 RepID=D8SLK3_SELML|nr:tetraspanin-19 [Selaginella moellendorffii]EFJ14787.1 hypothetical protein SELMODRAFT_229009 [Selaginella moellendorffii]|eukprot:XP_002984277.1 tetraspanin-19 [Selaginella moellendorffii]
MKCRGCLQIVVKLLNLLLFVIGLGMILYSVWMLNQLHKHGDDDDGLNSLPVVRSELLGAMANSSRIELSLPVPWFVYAFMGVGIFVCIISFSGYVAAEAASGCCLCCSSVFLGIFLLLQAALAATIFFDKSWERDFPKDPTGEIHSIRKFVEKNAEFCKWIGLSVVIVEVLSLLFGMILRAVIGDFNRSGYDSDDDYVRPPTRSNVRRQGSPPELSSTRSTKLRDKYAGEFSYTPSESRRLLQQNGAPEESRSRCTIM